MELLGLTEVPTLLCGPPHWQLFLLFLFLLLSPTPSPDDDEISNHGLVANGLKVTYLSKTPCPINSEAFWGH